jgi:hypothetical protein
MSANNFTGSPQKGTRKSIGGFQRLEQFSVAARCQQSHRNLAGTWTLADSAAIYQESHCLVSDDTGNDLCAKPQRRAAASVKTNV